MRLQMRCVDVHRSSGWSRFDLESVGDGDLGPDCPRSKLSISTTNPARLDDFRTGETYELELAPTQATVAPAVIAVDWVEVERPSGQTGEPDARPSEGQTVPVLVGHEPFEVPTLEEVEPGVFAKKRSRR